LILGSSRSEASISSSLAGRPWYLLATVYPRLLVIAPNQTRSHVFASSMPGCSRLQVHPVVAGATGRA